MYSTQATNQGIIDLNGGGNFILINGGNVEADGFDSPTYYVNGVVGTAITLNTWTHVTITTATQITVSNLVIGKEGTNYFEGQLKGVKMFGRVVSDADEISQIMWETWNK